MNPARGRSEATFLTTQWSLILHAGDDSSEEARAALESLCRIYWYPLYSHVRRLGWGPEDAQDLTQDFFARLLDRQYLKLADPRRGRFRSFLLTSIGRFAASEWEKRRALKRGAALTVPLFAMDGGEERYQLEPADGLSPDKLFEKRWAATLLETVLGRLRAEYVAAEKAAVFEAFKDCLWGGAPAEDYASLSGRLGMTEGALRVVCHRLRERYRALLREVVAETVESPAAVEDELRHLVAVMRE